MLFPVAVTGGGEGGALREDQGDFGSRPLSSTEADPIATLLTLFQIE